MTTRVTGSLASIAFVGSIFADVASAATYFESQTTAETPDVGRMQVTSVRAWVDGEQARIEFREGDQTGIFPAGSYMLTGDAGGTVYLVNPTEMTYAEVDLEQMLGFAGSVMQAAGGLVQMQVSDVSNEKIAEEPGGEILGFETTHYAFRTSYTMSVGVLGFSREVTNDMRQEFWCTDELDAAGFRLWLSPDRFQTGNAELDELITSTYQSLDCLPLRSRTEATTTAEGQTTTTVTTSEVTVLRRDEPVEPGTFGVPEGYTETSFMPQLPGGFQLPGAGQGPSQGEGPRLRDLLPGR